MKIFKSVLSASLLLLTFLVAFDSTYLILKKPAFFSGQKLQFNQAELELAQDLERQLASGPNLATPSANRLQALAQERVLGRKVIESEAKTFGLDILALREEALKISSQSGLSQSWNRSDLVEILAYDSLLKDKIEEYLAKKVGKKFEDWYREVSRKYL